MKKKSKLRIPVTQGLKDLYAMDMRMAYQAASLNQFNVLAFSRLAAAISVIRTALVKHDTKLVDAIEILDATIDILMRIRDRGDRSNVWEVTAGELPAILNGIDVAEQCIGTLDVGLLSETANNLLQDLRAAG